MAKDRLLLIVSIAILGFFAAFLLRNDSAPDVIDKQLDKTDVAYVMIAKEDLPSGSRLNKKNIEWKEEPLETVSPSYVTKDQFVEKWLDQAIVIEEIAKGEKIKRLDISWPGDELQEDVSLVLEQGRIAIPYVLDSHETTARLYQAGMFVDVVFSSSTDFGFGTLSLTLLKNLRIVSVERPDKDDQEAKTTILLEMTKRDAEIYSYASGSGDITLGLSENRLFRPENDDLHTLLHNTHSVNNFNSILLTYLFRQLFPGIDIDISKTSEGFIVSGVVRDSHIADKIRETLIKVAKGGEKAVVDLMKVKPQQVMIAVKVMEVSSEYQSQLGINWQALLENGGGAIALGATFPRPGAMDPNFFFDAMGIKIGDWTLSEIVDFLQQNGKANVLAEPNLTTVSGNTAEFFAGGEFPILIPQGGTLLGTVTVEYKKFGVILEFTPTVEINGLITLQVSPEVSTIDRRNSVVLAGFEIPSLIARRANTTVRLWPGQTYAIAGLLQDETLRNDYGIWGLDCIPVLGALFRSSRYRDKKTELMVLITPYLISSDQDDYDHIGECETDPCSDPNPCCEPQGIFDYNSNSCCDRPRELNCNWQETPWVDSCCEDELIEFNNIEDPDLTIDNTSVELDSPPSQKAKQYTSHSRRKSWSRYNP